MKRILSILLVLVMVISMLPMAVSAAEVASGLATASAGIKWTYSYTAPADGTLTITVGDGNAAWVSDVYDFGSWTTSTPVSGTAEASYTYEVTADTAYSVRIYGQDDAAITDIPYTITFTSASGEEDGSVTVQGEVMFDDSDVAMSGTDVAVTTAGINHVFTPAADGILTVHIISASTGWKYTGEGLPSKEGSGEAAYTHEVVGGTTYTINLGCYENWDWAAGTISYEILFYESELTVTQEPYIISETVIQPAEEQVTTSITMEENADMTVVTITPSVVGVFTITVPEGTALLNNVGGGTNYIADWSDADASISIEWTCKEVAGQEIVDSDGTVYYSQGQSMMLGIVSENETVDVTVAKTADYVATEAEVIVYENKAELSAFTLPEGATLGSYVDVYDETVHTAVLGEDGYYHLDSTDGDVLLIDMNYNNIVLSDALNSERPVMYAYVTLEDGTEIKYDIGDAVKEYEAVMDENGYYPLTEDLILFYEVYATDAGTWVYHLNDDGTGANADVWMYCCLTMALSTEDGGDDTNPVTVPAGEDVVWTAPATGTVKFTTESTATMALLDYEYNLIAEFTGSVTADVTEGTSYRIMNSSDSVATFTWEYVTDSEGGETETTNTLVLGENSLKLAEGDMDGDTWTYTAAEDGTLTATVSYLKYYVESYEVEGQFDAYEATADADLQSACGRLMQFIVNGTNAYTNTQSVSVKAGDSVTVQLISNYYYETEATLTLTMGADSGEEGGEPDGSAANPYIISELPATIEGTVTDTNGLYYQYTAAQDGVIEISDYSDYYVSVSVNGSTSSWPVTVSANDVVVINPWASSSADYSVTVSYQVPSEEPGSQSNPIIITEFPYSTNITFTEDNTETGFWYQYTATEDGMFLAELSNWGNADLYVNGTQIWGSTEVKAGDVILIHAYTWQGAGEYTMTLSDPTVAMIGDVRYDYFSSALYAAASGDTVKLMADVEYSDVKVIPGVTLDLNGYTLKAEYVVAYNGANIVDNSEANTGLLAVAADNVMISTTNSQLPVWNGSGYVFTSVSYKTKVDQQTEDSFRFLFLPAFQAGATALLEDGASTNKVSFEVRVSWTTTQGQEYRNLVYNEDQIDAVVGSAGAFWVVFSGFSNLDMLSDITVEGVVKSDTGVIITSTGDVVSIG